MIRTKYLGFIAIASSTLLFSGCIQQPDTFSNHNGYYNNRPNVNVSLVSYAYPYYYDRPYYFLNGLYYYGGYYRNGLYHYGQRRFRHGHYYHGGHRYYNGRRYRAVNGRHGYYQNRGYYQRSHRYKKRDKVRARSLHKGRNYVGRTDYKRPRKSYIGKDRRYTNNIKVRPRDSTRTRTWNNSMRRSTMRERPRR